MLVCLCFVCVHGCKCVFMCVCTCVFVCVHACTCVCTDACVCACSYVHVLLHKYMHMSVHVNANFIHIPVLHSHHASIYKPLSQHPDYQEIKLLAFSLSLPSWATILWQLSFLGAPHSQVLSPPIAGKPHSLFFLLLRCYTRTFPSKGFSITSTPNFCSCDHSIPPWSPHVLLRNSPQGTQILGDLFPHLVV